MEQLGIWVSSMAVWDNWKQRIDAIVDEVSRDPRFRDGMRDAERLWQDLEHEVTMIRKQLRENQRPITDDTLPIKQRLDAYRKKAKRSNVRDKKTT